MKVYAIVAHSSMNLGWDVEKVFSTKKEAKKYLNMYLVVPSGYTFEIVTWDVKSPIKLTKKEKIILKEISKSYDWITRDIDGSLYVFKEKPAKQKSTNSWFVDGGSEYFCELPFTDLFHFIKWSDEEPYNIEELLKSN